MPSRSSFRSKYADASALSAFSAGGADDDGDDDGADDGGDDADDDGDDDGDDGDGNENEDDGDGDEEEEGVVARAGSTSCCTLRSSRKSDDGECLVSARNTKNEGPQCRLVSTILAKESFWGVNEI